MSRRNRSERIQVEVFEAQIQSPPIKSEIKRAPIPAIELPVNGFWHICMINDYMDIINEQLKLLVVSNLYDHVRNIFITCCGDETEFQKVKNLFASSLKIKIVALRKLEEYEFPTLEYLKQKAQEESQFIAFYIHTKGVSWPGHEGGKYWRDYMNYYNITKWKDALIKLRTGHDTCGVKLIEKGDFPMHYSGNFWWAKSEYIKKLNTVSLLDKKDRYSAEMWICSSSPKAATLCQKFVDYNAKGKFIPDDMALINSLTGNPRIIVHTLAYNLPSEVKTAVKNLYSQNKENLNFEHVIVDLGFPLYDGNTIPADIEIAKEKNAKDNLATALSHGSKYISFKNEGVSQNWEKVRKHFKVGNDDILLCADPDERPKNNGWIKAVSDILLSGNKIAWCSLMMKEHLPYVSCYPKINICGHNLYLMSGGLNWAQGGFSGRFLNEIGGVPVPQGAPIYGWIESACIEKIQMLQYKVAILADYFVEHTECSPLYRQWKTQVTTHVKNGQMDFEVWLKQQQNKPLNINQNPKQ